MSMMKKIGIGAVIATGALGAAQSASAAYTVAGGGAFTGASTGITTLTNTRNAAQLKCTSSAAAGNATNGTGLAGAGIASISNLTFSSCTGPLSLTFTVASSASPTSTWAVNAVGATAGGVTPGTISGISATLTGPGCSAVVTGTAPGNYNNATSTLTVVNSTATGPTLTVGAGASCLGLISGGDKVNFNGAYELDPATLTINGTP